MKLTVDIKITPVLEYLDYAEGGGILKLRVLVGGQYSTLLLLNEGERQNEME